MVTLGTDLAKSPSGKMILHDKPKADLKAIIETHFDCLKGEGGDKCQDIPRFCRGVEEAGMTNALSVLGKYLSEMSSTSPRDRVTMAKKLFAEGSFDELRLAIPDAWAHPPRGAPAPPSSGEEGSDSSILNRAASQDGVGGVEHKEGEGGDSTSYDSSAHLTSVLGRAAGSKSLMFKVSLYHALCL